MTRRRLAGAAAAVAALALLPAVTHAGAEEDCSTPTVNALTSAEAAISRPAILSPSEYALSNVYSLVEQATKPQFTYAEAGPQYAGAFEALAPAGTPDPPRAVSAYPSEDIPDEAESDWGGTSRTTVSSISATALSDGARSFGVGDATMSNGRSWATTIVECDVVTIIAGWVANDVVFAPGASAEQLGEVITLVVGPDGASADVEVTVSGVEGAYVIPIEGRPADPFTDPMRENGGPTIEAGEPRTETTENSAKATGGGFNFVFKDPEAGQGASYRIGSLNGSIEVLGALEPASPVTTTVADTTPPSTSPPTTVARPVSTPTIGTTESAIGTPPPPSPAAVQAIDTVLVSDSRVRFVDVRDRDWTALFGFLGLLALVAASWGTVQVGRRWYPTLDWIARRTSRNARNFVAVYLKW